jgi:SulP family sulfate permease
LSSLIMSRIPLLGQLRESSAESIRGDAVAGLTTAIMLIPQAMAYAMLAGLDPIIGLYASTVPVAIYALLGTSRQLAVGPVAMVSLLVASGVGAIAGDDVATFTALAALLALMVGAMQWGMGVARLGFLVKFLSHPVISGFTSAAALIIGFSQLKHLLGVPLERSHHIHTILLQARSLWPSRW